MKRNIIYSTVIIILIALDQVIKEILQNWLLKQPNGTHSFIKIGNKEILDLTYCENTGMAFSLLADKRILVIILTTIFLGFLVFWFFKNITVSKFQNICLTFIIAGGLSNLIDRIFRTYVIDFFEIKLFHFGIFNVADMFVCVGVFFYCISFIKEMANENKRISGGLKDKVD